MLLFYMTFKASAQNNNLENDTNKEYIQSIMPEIEERRDSLLKEPYPDFFAISTSGDTIRRGDILGKVTFINFWFENCRPCIAELDDLSNLYHKFKDNSSFLFLSFTVDNRELAEINLKKYNLSYLLYPINRQECMKLNFYSGFPTTIILNKEGKVVLHKIGGSVNKENVIKQIEKYEKTIVELLSNK